MSIRARITETFQRPIASGRYLAELEGLRFIAIAMVVLFHVQCYLLVKLNLLGQLSGTDRWLERLVQHGGHGVELFFAISGFILALPFAEHHLHGRPAIKLRSHYLRRLTRLEPPYLLTLLICYVLLTLSRGGTWSTLALNLLASSLYLHNAVYGEPSAINLVAWTLEIEIQFYVLVPFLTKVFAIRGAGLRRSAIVLLGAAAPLLRGGLNAAGLTPPQTLLSGLEFFAVGFLLADLYLVQSHATLNRTLRWDAVSLIGWPLLPVLWSTPHVPSAVVPVVVLMLYLAAFRGRGTSWLLSHPLLTTIGGMCYTLYLIHVPVISGIGRFTLGLTAGRPYWQMLLAQSSLIGAGLLVIAVTFYLLVERPCMDRNWPARLWARLRLPAQFPSMRRADSIPSIVSEK